MEKGASLVVAMLVSRGRLFENAFDKARWFSIVGCCAWEKTNQLHP